MWRWALLLVSGCYSPRVPTGVACNPAAPQCPEGQECIVVGGANQCGPPGGGDVDAATVDAVVDPLGHLQLAPGWTAFVYRDFSSEVTFNAAEFVDGDETFGNLPDWVFTLDAPFTQGIGIVAGRRVIELSPTTFTPHDFGQHAPNTFGLPDHLCSGIWIADLDGAGPALMLTSSSRTDGDGTFTVSPSWVLDNDNAENNTRGVLYDAAGVFDMRPTAEGYLGSGNGVVRRSDDMIVFGGDIRTIKLLGSDMLATRHLLASVELVKVASTTHTVTPLATSTKIRIGEGAAPAPYIAWAIVDERKLALVTAAGTLDTIAETTDAEFLWQSVTVPAAPHPLAGGVYVLEGNRALDIDRVLVLRSP